MYLKLVNETAEPCHRRYEPITPCDRTGVVFRQRRHVGNGGVQLTGKESAAVTYSPGGILDWFFGSGTNDAAPERPEIEVNEIQSIFG